MKDIEGDGSSERQERRFSKSVSGTGTPKTYPLLLAPCLLQAQNAVWVLGQQPISACKALLDLGLHTPTHPQPHPGILML